MRVGGKQRGRGGPTHESAKESGGTRVGPRLTSSAQTVRNSKREGWVGEEEGKKEEHGRAQETVLTNRMARSH
jgi:hypothetical protein